MPEARITFVGDGDGAFPDLAGREDVIHIGAAMLQIAALRNGMTSAKNSLVLRIDLPSGGAVLAETSVAMFLGIALAIQSWDEGEDGAPRGTPARGPAALLQDLRHPGRPGFSAAVHHMLRSIQATPPALGYAAKHAALRELLQAADPEAVLAAATLGLVITTESLRQQAEGAGAPGGPSA